MKNKLLIGIIICILIVGVLWIMDPLHIQTGVKGNSNTKVIDEISNNDINENHKENEEDEIIGKWNTISAVNSDTGEKVENLRDIFGSSYSQYGSYFEFREDNTFIDALEPITNGNKATTGTYEVKKNYNRPGDCYIFLTYSDGTESKLEKVILDDSNTSYLVLENLVNGYQFSFQK